MLHKCYFVCVYIYSDGTSDIIMVKHWINIVFSLEILTLLQNSVMLLGLFLCQVDNAFTIYCTIIITNYKSKETRAKRG